MIVITLDGLSWTMYKRNLTDMFKNKTEKKMLCNIRKYTNTPERGQPTIVGLLCLWTGKNPNRFDDNLFAQMAPKHNQNYPLKIVDKKGNPMETIFDKIENSKIYTTSFGPNPYFNYETYFKYFTEMKNVELLPTEENTMLYECTLPHGLIWWHSSLINGMLRFGPYEQLEHPTLRPYREWRKDKVFKSKVFEFDLMRKKYLIQCLEKMLPNETIVVTADHGTLMSYSEGISDVDEFAFCVNKKDVDLSDTKFQWEIKDLLLKLKKEEDNER